MDIKQLRDALRLKWLNYCQENRSWLVKMQVWRTYDGVRRPSSGYILATLSVLEPSLQEVLPFILELNNNPDEIVAALGLNFNPDEELCLLDLKASVDKKQVVHKNSLSCSELETQIKEDAHTNFQDKKKQVLLTIVPSVVPTVEEKQESVCVVRISKPVYFHYPLIREEISPQTGKLGIRRSPSVNTQTITKSIPIKYQFTGLPVKEVFYISATTNAPSLPAWMDEFCPGVNGIC